MRSLAQKGWLSMAMRPVFVVSEVSLVRKVDTEFVYHNGLSRAQRMRSAQSLREAFLTRYPDRKLLEVSRFSPEELGTRLSAFNLLVTLEDGMRVPVECAYQGGKVFEKGGPYTDLLTAAPKAAKTDPRLHESGSLVGYEWNGKPFPSVPVRLFYTWMYMKALRGDEEVSRQLCEYDAFTDIVFNPAKSINCQAYACAAYVALRRRGEVDQALEDPDFLSGLLRGMRF